MANRVLDHGSKTCALAFLIATVGVFGCGGGGGAGGGGSVGGGTNTAPGAERVAAKANTVDVTYYYLPG